MQDAHAKTDNVNETNLNFLKIADVDREQGCLTIRGYDIGELTGRVSFEEIAYLLWHGKLPTSSALEELSEFLSRERALQPAVLENLRVLSQQAGGMDVLRMGAAVLSIGYEYAHTRDLDIVEQQAARLTAQIPALVAHSWRLSKGLEIIEPKPEHGLAEGFLFMLEGKEPVKHRIDALNAYLVTIAEHGLNASTFALRVIIGTDSDLVSALTGAIGALKGPRHGGAPGPVHAMLEEIGQQENAEDYIKREVAAGRQIMGFGHSIYRVRDPRATVLCKAVEALSATTGDRRLLDVTLALEQTGVKLLDQLLPGGDHYANVELYAALILGAIGIPAEIFTEVFAIGRTAGWTAHMIDQLEEDRLIRPSSLYTGERGLKYIPIEARA